MKRSYQLIIALALTSALVFLLLREVRVSDIVRTVASVGVKWMLISFILYLLSITIRAARFHLLLHGKIDFKSMLHITYLHNLSNNLLPSFLGELSFVYLARQTGRANTGESTAVLVVSRFWDIAAVFGLTAIALFFVPEAPSQFTSLLFGIGILLVSSAVFLVCFVLYRKRAISAVEWAAGLISIRDSKAIKWSTEKLHETADALNMLHGARMYSLTIGVSVMVWLLAYAQCYVLMVAMGYNVTFMVAALGTSLYRLASSLPVYGIGGFGTVELTWTAAFVLLGMTTQDAIVSGFSVHIITLSYAVLLGAIGSILYLQPSSRPGPNAP